MPNLIDQQITMFETWSTDVGATQAVNDVFRRSVEIARDLRLNRNDPYFVLCALTEQRTIDGVDLNSLGINMKTERLLAWLDTPEARDEWASGNISDITQNPMFDMLQAINTFNRALESQDYRRYRVYELAIGVLASDSGLVRRFFKERGVSRSKQLQKLGLTAQEATLLLDLRHRTKRNVLAGYATALRR